MKKNIIPIELKNAICENQLIIFVGAGLSYNLININDQQIKGWTNLVEQVLKDLKKNGYDVDHLIPLSSKYDPIKVLDLIELDKNIPKTEIYRFIKGFFDLNDQKNYFELHKKLYKLSKKIVTTNYDTAFEKAIPELRKNKAYKGKNYELITHKDPNAALLYKLHGCFEDIDSMILFPTSYDNLYKNTNRDAEHSLLVLRNIIYNKSILFIGTGMGDFQINNLFKEIKEIQGVYNQKHFIITNKPLDSSLSFLTALPVNQYKEIETIIDNLILIKEESGNKESDDIITLKKQLEEANRKIEGFNSEDLLNKSNLLEREALKYFSKGVEFSLSNEHKKASKEYKTALELNPDYHEALYNWGTGLGILAKAKKGKEAEELYKEAFDKFKKAIDIKPDFHKALYNWGTYLGNLAQTKEGKEAEELYKEAFDKFEKAIEYGASSYNLSCVFALKGEKEKALKYLNNSLSKADIDVDFIEKDKDWKDYLADEEFNMLLKKYKK